MKTVLVILATALTGLCQAQRGHVAHGYINTEPAGCPTSDGAEAYDAHGNQTGAIPAGADVSVNLQNWKPGLHWISGLDFDGRSISGYVPQDCVTMGKRSALAPSDTAKAPSRSANPCQELAASLGVKSLAAYNELAITERPDIRGDEDENLVNTYSCILSPQATRADRQAALFIRGELLVNRETARLKSKDAALHSAEEVALSWCADQLDKFKDSAERDRGQFFSLWGEYAKTMDTCGGLIEAAISAFGTGGESWSSKASSATRVRAFKSFIAARDEIFKLSSDASVTEYQNQIKAYNELVSKYNTLLDKYSFVLSQANALARRPVILWTPPPPPKEIHCITSGTINTYGSITISASTNCQEY
ncbi:MAG TPA: hypothetical protein VN176_09660 [Verrucomicrobiae bacterium]|jgi:hypothetical protein|nr:hypothetical protein [Verrucomicrobiae bacterium]